MPKSYNQASPKHIPPTRSEPKLNYIDYLLRAKKCVPAPNAYEFSTVDRPLSGKMDKSPRLTQAAAILGSKKKDRSPGPGAYFTRPQTAHPNPSKHTNEYR